MEKMGFLRARQPRQRVNILGVLVDQKNMEQAVETIEEWVWRKRSDPSLAGKRVVTANPEYVMTALRDTEFSQVVNGAGLVTVDGVGLIMAGLLFGTPFQERVTGVELTHALARCSSETGLRLFLLGAGPGVAEEAAQNLRKLYPGVAIVGCFSGKAGPEGDAESLKQIREAQADVVLVAYGMGKQDYWAVRNLDLCGAAATIGIGGTLDFLSGRVPRAPKTIRRLGLEWAYRLYREPWRWRRDIAMFQFALKAIQMSFFRFNSNGAKLLVLESHEPATELRLAEYNTRIKTA